MKMYAFDIYLLIIIWYTSARNKIDRNMLCVSTTAHEPILKTYLAKWNMRTKDCCVKLNEKHFPWKSYSTTNENKRRPCMTKKNIQFKKIGFNTYHKRNNIVTTHKLPYTVIPHPNTLTIVCIEKSFHNVGKEINCENCLCYVYSTIRINYICAGYSNEGRRGFI